MGIFAKQYPGIANEFTIETRALRRLKHQLTNVGASLEIDAPYFSQPCKGLLGRMKNMGLAMRETERLGKFKITRVA